MTLQACAEIVKRGDPDRFLATMAAPPKARAILFPIFAFNVEVARAPWVTEEPMIAEMRLQWWRDALDEIGKGGPVRKHEVTTLLAEVLDAEGAALLDGLVQARRWDVYKDAFENRAHFDEYLDRTAGNLLWAAARALGSTKSEDVLRTVARASGLANLFVAVPELEKSGRKPMVDGRASAVVELANKARQDLMDARKSIPPAARPATRTTWQAAGILKRAAADPNAILDGALLPSEFAKKGSLLIRSTFGLA